MTVTNAVVCPDDQEQETKRRLTIGMKKDRTMSNNALNFALQVTATLALTGLLGAALFGFADFATRGVIA